VNEEEGAEDKVDGEEVGNNSLGVTAVERVEASLCET